MKRQQPSAAQNRDSRPREARRRPPRWCFCSVAASCRLGARVCRAPLAGYGTQGPCARSPPLWPAQTRSLGDRTPIDHATLPRLQAPERSVHQRAECLGVGLVVGLDLNLPTRQEGRVELERQLGPTHGAARDGGSGVWSSRGRSGLGGALARWWVRNRHRSDSCTLPNGLLQPRVDRCRCQPRVSVDTEVAELGGTAVVDKQVGWMHNMQRQSS